MQLDYDATNCEWVSEYQPHLVQTIPNQKPVDKAGIFTCVL